MIISELETFNLDNFEGPLDLLWHLIIRQEIDIYQISLVQITKQFLERTRNTHEERLDRGAEFISLIASLLCLKSKTLLPKHEQITDVTVEEDDDPKFEIIHQLVDYCRFKQAAKELSERERQQGAFYSRGVESAETKKNLGIDHLSLDDLAVLFQQILSKAAPQRGIISEEEWKVSDKIKSLKLLINKYKSLAFNEVFNVTMSRAELIVTFLALLELMKAGDLCVALHKEKKVVCIFTKTHGYDHDK